MVRFAAATLILTAMLPAMAARGTEILMLDFWSPQCGPCLQMKPTIESFKKAGYPIREVDATRDHTLVRQFNVTQLPCFVMLVDGQEVDRQVGSTGVDRLQGMYKQAHEVVRRMAEQRRGQSPDLLSSHQQPVSPSPGPGEGPGEGASNAADVSHAADELHTKLLAATVRLRVDDAKGHSYGTGTIIDARSGQALVITCGHLFRESQGKGPVDVELFDVVSGSARAAGQIPAQVISYDLKRDIALVGIWPNQPVIVAPIASPGAKIDRGERVMSVGCSNGNEPTVLASRITTLDRYQGPPNIEASGAPVEGRSGGGLFNTKGELIGVCFAADYESNEGLYAALESIHDELAARGLSDISSTRIAAANARGDATVAPAETQVVRGQEPLTPVTSVADQLATAASAGPSTAAVPMPASTPVPDGLNVVEQAAWEEIMTRAANAEVICIIRPKEPGGQSEVITLDDVSPAFVRALAERRRASPETRQR